MAQTIDLRTYVLLEKAFTRRLQRSWRQQSAPIYEKITQACLDHHWDEARRLVTDLDMTEVGTTNREWIQYMLLSCAVFGANTVAKGKPSFVGTGNFDTFLKQTTNNLLQYLEHGGTSQIQAEALQSIAEDEAKTKAVQKVAFDPSESRDKKGRWTKGGSVPAVIVDGDPIGLAAEARKAGSFEEFEKDFTLNIKHGLYWHLTDNPDFAIDTAKGPRDMSSMGDLGATPGALMVTSHLENWDEYYNVDPNTEEPKVTRPYAVMVDLSDVPRKDYHQISRGFGNEFFVPDSAKAKVLGVVPVKTALALDAKHQAALPQSQEELRSFYDKAIKTEKFDAAKHPRTFEHGHEGEFTEKEGMRWATHKDAARLKALKVPPGWSHVQLSIDPEAELQAVGLDAAGRTQPIYSAEHTKEADAEKFERIKEFAKILPSLREKILHGMHHAENAKDKDAAAVLYLIDKTGFRIGSKKETGGAVKAYGATTLLGKHVRVLAGDRVSFRFVAKKGVFVEKVVHDHVLATMMKVRKQGSNEPLFNVSDGHVRDYMEEIEPGFHPKDFRTYQGTSIAMMEVMKRKKPVKSEAEFKKVQKAIASVVASHLGNTAAVSLKKYIDPAVWGHIRRRVKA